MQSGTGPANSAGALWRIRLLHTAVWAVFAAAILAIPITILLGALHAALWLGALVWIEVLVLLANGMRCPLTGVAGRFTASRADNFDIFLPEALARYNKLIFGTLFVGDELLLLWRWSGY
jgi:hypothetical protein